MKPMLAATIKDTNDLKFPLLATPKLDGIRCLIIDGKAMSRSLKPIPNRYVQKMLSSLPHGLDGELMLKSGDFNSVQSAIMSEDGEPDFEYNIFDFIGTKFEHNRYTSRLDILENYCSLPKFCKLILPVLMENIDDLNRYEHQCIQEGFEGVMLRARDSPYKFGRSTMKEQYLMKLKRFYDSEAKIIGFEELMHNDNEAKEDNLGHTKRSSKKDGLVGAGTLGMLKVKDIHNGIEFGLGTGFTAEMRRLIWQNQQIYIGKIVNYRFQGIVEKPRFPSFRGFRSEIDL